MHRRTIAFQLAFLAVVWLSPHAAAGGLLTTPLQMQSIPQTQTNWGPGTSGITDPFTFTQFDPNLGTLAAVNITLTSTIRNDFMLIFVQTPSPTTIYVATTQTSDPSVLSDPNRVNLLTDGPTVTLKGPDGVAQIFGAPGTTLPVDVVSMTEPSGTWSSMLPITDPHFIAPNIAGLSLSRTLTPSNAASLISQFIGTGTINLPITATAYSSFYANTGNGGGLVLTRADATVTLQYQYTAATPAVPEPASLILLGLGMSLGFVVCKWHRRGVSPAESDRT